MARIVKHIAVTALLMLSLPGLCTAQFATGGVIDREFLPDVEGCRIADMDGDGMPDVVLWGNYRAKVGWCRNWGAHGYSRTIPLDNTPAYFVEDLELGDLDGDLDIDLVYMTDSGHVLWAANSGSGAMGIVTLVVSVDGDPSNLTDVDLADMDGDQDLDIVFTEGENEISGWCANDGAGNFGQASLYAWDPIKLVPVDMDQDGDTDVAFSVGGSIVWQENNGSGLMGASHSVYSGGSFHLWITAGDMDGDQDMDLVASTNADGPDPYEMHLFTSSANGQSWTMSNISSFYTQSGDAELADMDGDGDPDVIGSSYFYNGTNKKVRIYPNNGNGTFGTATQLSAYWPGNLMPADLDLDGDMDLVLCDLERADVWTNNGGGSLTHQRPLIATNGGLQSNLNIADIDGDGDLDGVRSGSESFEWHENTGGPVFDTVIYQEFNYYPGSSRFQLLYDLDGDGLEDRIYPSGTWQRNLGGAVFNNGQFISAGYSARHILPADLDGDGDDDIVMSAGNGAQWLRYNAQDTLLMIPQYRSVAGGNLLRSYAADLDLDGDLDIVSCDFTDNTVSWRPNMGFNSAQLPPSITISSLAADIATVEVGDIDQDGDPDIVYELDSTNDVVWLANNGLGVFAAASVLITGPDEIADIEVFDRDNDGDLDLMVGVENYLTQTHWIGMAENLGSAQFGSLTMEVDNANCPCIPEDMDLDGDIDLVYNTIPWHDIVWGRNDWAISTSATESGAPGTDLLCYPVPFGEHVQVRPRSPFAVGTRYILVDASGRTVRTGAVNSYDALRLDRQDLRPGLHTLLIVEPGKPNRSATLVVE